MLSDGKSRNTGPEWANDGKRFAYSTTRRNARDYDIHIAGIGADSTSVPALEEGGAWFAGEWSPDDSKLLIARYVSINENYPYLLDLESKELTPLGPPDKKIGYGDATFAKDGKGIYGSSDEDSEFTLLRYYDLESGKSEVLTQDIPWDVEDIELSEDGRYLAFTVNEDGISKLHVRDLETGQDVKLPKIPEAQVYSIEFSPTGHTLAFGMQNARTPGDVYSLDLGGGKLLRWTRSEVGGLRTDEFVLPELIHYPTFDKVDGKPRMIPAFYHRPKGDGPHPVLIDIHGGPEGQERPYFSAQNQYLVNELGIAILAPNVRGSSGYGKSYLKLDNGYKREDSVKDIGKLLDWIETRPELDSKRVAVIGGSYGGYMVLASMVHYNDRLVAGIDIVGISSFVTFLENTKPYRQNLRRVEYGDERDPEMRKFLAEISPLTNAHKITKPLFIAQGLNDPRVPAGESEQIVKTVRENGGEAWYMLATDEGHGFAKKSNRDYFAAAASLFLETYLLGANEEAKGD
jgi:dipeptidyl aminopeptidase/acylaminoacyl peptidase